MIGLEDNRPILYNRINTRVNAMLEDGLLDEAKRVHPYNNINALKTVGYTELFKYLEGELDYVTAVEKIKINSRRYAKRQLTWFKRMNGVEWFTPLENEKISMYIRNILEA